MTQQMLSWRAIRVGVPVLDADGNEFGGLDSVLADDREDIFHGISVKRKGTSRLLEVVAAKITGITDEQVTTSVRGDEVDSLPIPKT